jgi:hypothetical protein
MSWRNDEAGDFFALGLAVSLHRDSRSLVCGTGMTRTEEPTFSSSSRSFSYSARKGPHAEKP